MPWFWCGEVKKSSCELDTWEPQIFFRTGWKICLFSHGLLLHAPHHHLKAGQLLQKKELWLWGPQADSNTSFHLHGLRCRPENCDATSLPQLLRGLLRCMQRANCRWHCILACHQHPEPSVSELPLDDFGSQGHSCAQQQVLAPSSVHIQDTFKNGCSTAS